MPIDRWGAVVVLHHPAIGGFLALPRHILALSTHARTGNGDVASLAFLIVRYRYRSLCRRTDVLGGHYRMIHTLVWIAISSRALVLTVKRA